MTCLKRRRMMLTPDSVPGGRVREKVPTGGNANKNRAPSCAGFVSGRGRTRASPGYLTGHWSG